VIDSQIIHAINQRNNMISQSNYEYVVSLSYGSDEELETILFSPPENPKAAVFALERSFLSNTRGALAITENYLFFYSFAYGFVSTQTAALPLNSIVGKKIHNLRNWNHLEVSYKTEKGKMRKWKFKIPASVAKLEHQQENVKALLEYLEERTESA